MIIEGQELPKIVPPPKADDGVQQVIKPDLQPGRAKGPGKAGTSVSRASGLQQNTGAA